MNSGEVQVRNEHEEYGTSVVIATLLVGVLIYTNSIASPVLSTISSVFPDVPATTIKLISSIPMLMMCICSPVAGMLTRWISIKKCIIIAGLFIITGALPLLAGSFPLLLLSRITFGIGYGLAFPMASVLITDLFTGEKRTWLMGAKSAIGAVSGMVLQTLAGYLAVYNWRLCFLPHLIALLILAVLFVFLPDTGKKAPSSEENKKSFSFITGYYLALLGFSALLNLLEFSFMQEISFVITEKQIGNAVNAAMVMNVFLISSFAGGMLHARITKIFGKYTIVFAGLMTGIAFLFGIWAGSLPVLYIMAAFFGIGFSTSNPGFVLMVSDSVKQKKDVPLAVSIHMSLAGFSQFLSAYVMSFLMQVMGREGAVYSWVIAACGILLGTAVGGILLLFHIRRQA